MIELILGLALCKHVHGSQVVHNGNGISEKNLNNLNTFNTGV